MQSFKQISILVGVTLFMTLGFGSAQAQDYVPGEVLIKLKGKSSSASANQFFGKMQGKLALKSSVQALNIHRFGLKPGANVQSTIQELMADPAVEFAEPNYILRKFQSSEDSLAASAPISDDEMRAQARPGDTYTQSNANVGVDQSWSQMSTLAQVPERPIVAIIDTGVDYTHTVFQGAGAMWVNSGEIPNNGVDDDGNGYIDDVNGWNFQARSKNPMDDDQYGHGTHVAGIVLGVGQDIFANTMEPAKVRLMALKFLGADGSGATSDAISAIYYAVNNGAQVINNSWGGAGYSQSLHDALTYAYDHKVLVVSAAGNASKNNDTTAMYPANYPVPGQISVAATNDSDSFASFSNYGVGTVHVAAPGVAIYSTNPHNSYRFLSGTSMATPFVSGLAALALREAPNLSGYQLKNLLMNSATVLTNLQSRVSSSARVDAYNAIVTARSQVNATSFQPAYKAESREIASTSAGESGPKGCGVVSTALMSAGAGGRGGGGPSTPTVLIVIAFSLLPLIAWQVVRSRTDVKQRRRYDRFLMNSTVRVNVQGRELIGHMRTISEGGLSFEANTMLEKGGVVTMQIQSPDGNESIQVQGHIVWSEQNKAYGVQFDEARDTALSSIRQWTQRLVRVANY